MRRSHYSVVSDQLNSFQQFSDKSHPSPLASTKKLACSNSSSYWSNFRASEINSTRIRYATFNSLCHTRSYGAQPRFMPGSAGLTSPRRSHQPNRDFISDSLPLDCYTKETQLMTLSSITQLLTVDDTAKMDLFGEGRPRSGHIRMISTDY